MSSDSGGPCMSVLDDFVLDGKTAIVTGGSRGIGRALAEALAEAGADVCVANRDGDEATEAAREIADATGVETTGVSVDVTEEADVERLVDVGLSYMGINRFEEATETFERAASFADEDSLAAQEAWVNKGAAHAQLEEFDQAIGAYKEALRIDEDSEHAATAETNLAYALWESGQGEQALEHAERAVEADPRFAEAWYNRGFLLVERGLAEDAVTCFDNAIRLGYRSAGVLEEKARALEEAGEHEQAEEVADRAEELRREAEGQMVEEQTGQAPGPGGQPGGRGGAGEEQRRYGRQQQVVLRRAHPAGPVGCGGGLVTGWVSDAHRLSPT